jgi:two-component system, chemotaxis family, response regulator PixG
LRQNQLLATLETVRFSGQLICTDSTGQQWIIYISQGSILYATGGAHPVRRWRRNVALYCPQMALHRVTWYFDLAKLPAAALILGWEYALLNLWRSRQEITAEQIAKIVHSNVIEALFEIAQAGNVTERIQQNGTLSAQLEAMLHSAAAITVEAAIAAAQLRWKSWQNAHLADYLPYKAPVIRQPKQLQSRNPALYQNLSSLLNGQHTLYDLAVQVKRNVIDITASLLPCMQLEWIELISISDFPVPMLRRDVPQLSLAPAASKQSLIACVDDSQTVRQMMEELLTSAGYQFVGIGDPLRAIGVLLNRKPDLIFLDLMMPNANGHEVCEQLRKLSCFRNTPIVILTGSDGYANRLRSNFVGASDFLAKPLDAGAVLNVIQRHLEKATHYR